MMEKIIFMSEDMQEIEFFVLEQTKLNGVSYILVTDSEDGDAECWIMKDVSTEESLESIYDMVEDDDELLAVFAHELHRLAHQHRAFPIHAGGELSVPAQDVVLEALVYFCGVH